MSSEEEGTPPTSAPLAELPITSDRAPSFAARPGGGRKGQPPFFVLSFVFSFLIRDILAERDTLWIALGELLHRNTIF